MPELPRLSGRQTIKIFEALGFSVVRQKGSHVVLRPGDKGCVIPLHRELAVGKLRSAIKQAGITMGIFSEAINKK
jgi:predicted RNA binding protein YcfA (HicA-like mRNA interferase family)